MSEVRSISEGTFVIGDTNGLTFEAGPGISVSQPSEGTVRIANDETVLYNSSALINRDQPLGTTFNISEPVTNFERFKVYYTRYTWSDPCPTAQIQEFDSSVNLDTIVLHTTFPTSTSDHPTWYDCTESITGASGTTWKLNACSQMQLPNGNLDSSWIYLKPYKIVGINRISGGNNE